MSTASVILALKNALKNTGYPKNVLVHSDRGTQFTSIEFRNFLALMSLAQSLSAKGYPYDNAVAESFFKYFKQGELNRRCYTSLKELELSAFTYIEKYYNNYNPHSFNNGLTPNKKEQLFPHFC